VYNENGGVFEVITIPGSENPGTFIQLDYPGSIFTQATGLNSSGQVAGTYQDSSGASHGFVYDIKSATFSSVDAPNGTGITLVNSINDLGQLAGFIMPTSTTASGFVATPKK
jgi:hypothetical protein